MRVSTGQKRAPDLITDGCEPPCGCWELNSGPLEEQAVLLTSEPSLQPPFSSFLIFIAVPLLFYAQIVLPLANGKLMSKLHQVLSLSVSLLRAKPWTGEMAPRLRTLTALPEVLSSIPSNHMVAHSHL